MIGRHIRRAEMLKPVVPDVFSDPNACSFNFFGEKVVEIPYNPELLLKIVRAKFIGCCLEAVPVGLNKYTIISNLNLSDNFITEVSKKFLSSFCCLDTLNLASNCLVSFRPGLCSSLRNLDLSYNRGLNVEDVWKLDCPTLEVLKVTHCSFAELPNYLPKWSATIIHLFLDGNSLREIPDYIKEFKALEELSLFGNRIETPPKNKIHTLKTLSIAYNYIKKWESTELSSETLNISGNMFTEFPTTIFEMCGLRSLIISRCEIAGELNFAIPQSIAALDVSKNKITSLGETFIGSMTHISVFKASFNNISKIADAFPEDCKLNQFILEDNEIESFPPSFVNAKYIDVISMKNNKLKDISSIPTSHLRLLNISFNCLDSLPDIFENCSCLAILNVSYNKLSHLPKSLYKCKKITDFNASGNNLTVLPHCIVAFSQLSSLIVSDNSISTIPEFLNTSFFLNVLDFSSNNLSTVPSFIKDFNSLEVLSLAHNRITEFEDGFDLPQRLKVMDMSYNKIDHFNFETPCPSVKSLNLDCNNITKFEADNYPNIKFLSLNSNPLSKPFSPLISSLALMSFDGAFEMVNCGKIDGEVPPLPYHILSDSHVITDKSHGVGYSATMGMRPTMEDVVTIFTFNDDQSIFALFDGHKGNVSASIASLILSNEMRNIIDLPDETFPGMFSSVFTKINHKLHNFNADDGCTAVSAFIRGNDCYSISIGDSRIIRVKKNSVERLTTDFKPMMRCEYERLISNGANISSDGRIDSKLAVSRTIGDFWCINDKREDVGGNNALYVEPDVNKFTIEDDDIAIIIACDGVWDVLSDASVGELVRRSKSPQDAATKIRVAAFSQGSSDNISVIAVFLHTKDEYKGIVYNNEVEETFPTEEDIKEELEYEHIFEEYASRPKRTRR